jgi:K+-transporting ATPase KdpF subunit
MPRSAPGSNPTSGATPMFDYFLGGAVSLAILVYLVYALLRPEKF